MFIINQYYPLCISVWQVWNAHVWMVLIHCFGYVLKVNHLHFFCQFPVTGVSNHLLWMSDEQEYLGEAFLYFSRKCMKMEGTFSLDVYLILTEVVIAKKKLL